MPTLRQERLKRILRFLTRRSAEPAYRFDDVPDPRDARGVRWSVGQQLRAVWLALLMGASTIREVESSSEELGTARRRNGRLDRLPDSTLEYLLPDLEVAAFRAKLRGQVYRMQRAKALDPVDFPLGVLAVDGKTLGSYDNDLGGAAQKNTLEDGSPYWLLRVLRAVLVTALTKPCIDQGLIAAHTNDMGAFPTFFEEVMKAYGRSNLFEVITADAGFTSEANARLVNDADKGYVLGLKGNQPELLAEARRLLEPTTDSKTGAYRVATEAETSWERHQGKRIRRQLWRTTGIAGWGNWTHLRQVVLVRQTTEDPSSLKAPVIEDRYFVTNLVCGRLDGDQ
jgi:hypothetical protein